MFCAYDSRGFGESGGEVGVDGPNEVADALTLLDQLALGEVGGVSVNVTTDADGPVCAMDGLSYAGGIQLNTMAVSTADAADRLLPSEASFETISFAEGSPSTQRYRDGRGTTYASRSLHEESSRWGGILSSSRPVRPARAG